MLGKLLKYEMRSTSRLLGIIYLAVLALSLVLGISGRSFFQKLFVASGSSDSPANRIFFFIMLAAYIILVIALAVITVVAIVKRFYDSMLTGEAYLMHTLPIPTWMHVACRTISGVIWDILGGVVIMLSLVLILVSGGAWKPIMAEIAYLFESGFFASWDIKIGLWVAASLISSIRLILMFYVSMAVGGMSKKYKKPYSVLTFICIMIGIEIFALVSGFGTGVSLELFGDDTWSLWTYTNTLMAKDLIMDSILMVVFFILTTFFLQKKLNLE